MGESSFALCKAKERHAHRHGEVRWVPKSDYGFQGTPATFSVKFGWTVERKFKF